MSDPRIQLISQRNAGTSAARNSGINAASGRYVAFLDADDIWLPHKLERQLALLEARPDAHAVQAGATFVDDRRRVLSVRPCRPWRDGVWDVLRFQNLPAFPSTFLADRDRLREKGGFDTSLVILEDWEMAIHALRHWNLQSIEEPLALYRVHPNNRSRDVSLHVEPGHLVLERLFADPSLPPEVAGKRDRAYARLYAMLAGGAFNARDWRDFVRWSRAALRRDPAVAGYMARLPLRRLSRRLSRL